MIGLSIVYTFASTTGLQPRRCYAYCSGNSHLFIPGLILADQCQVVELLGNVWMVLAQHLTVITSPL